MCGRGGVPSSFSKSLWVVLRTAAAAAVSRKSQISILLPAELMCITLDFREGVGSLPQPFLHTLEPGNADSEGKRETILIIMTDSGFDASAA